MIRAIPARILRQILLVVVGAEAFSCTEISALSRLGHVVGLLVVLLLVIAAAIAMSLLVVQLLRIQQVNQLALREEHPVESRYQAASQTLLLIVRYRTDNSFGILYRKGV